MHVAEEKLHVQLLADEMWLSCRESHRPWSGRPTAQAASCARGAALFRKRVSWEVPCDGRYLALVTFVPRDFWTRYAVRQEEKKGHAC